MNSYLWILITTIVIAVVLAVLVNKVIPLKMYGVVKVIFWAIIGFLGYQLTNSVFEPVRFNKEKVARYKTVITNLKDIRNTEILHGKLKGEYSDNWQELIKFIETAQIPIIVQYDSIIKYDDKATGITGLEREIKVIDTLRWVSVKDSLFKNSTRYKSMMYIPVKDKFLYYKTAGKDSIVSLLADDPANYNGSELKPLTFELKTADFPYRGDTLSLFRARIDKKYILADQNPDLVNQERQALENDQIKGAMLLIGSLEEVKESGNWPPLYEKK